MHRSTKAQKNTENLTVFFALFGPAHVKAACRMLMKLTPRLVCLKTSECVGWLFTLVHIATTLGEV